MLKIYVAITAFEQKEGKGGKAAKQIYHGKVKWKPE